MPAEHPFFDTNIVVYGIVGDGWRQQIAKSVMYDGGTISVEVLNELSNVLLRKHMKNWATIQDISAATRALFHVRPVTKDIHIQGLFLAERYGFALYDSMIVAAALESGCDVLWSEDMQHGMKIGSLEIRNPFV